MAHGYRQADLDVYPSEVPLVCNKARVPRSRGATKMSHHEYTRTLLSLTLQKGHQFFFSEVDLHI